MLKKNQKGSKRTKGDYHIIFITKISSLTGIPIEPGRFFRKKLCDAEINRFLDFIQYSGIIQDVASGTRNVTLSTGKKVVMPNVVRTVHKSEAIRLYINACNLENHTQAEGRPCQRTLWNIINNCPASQRKSLSGLDNIASEGSDAFDKLIHVCKAIEGENMDDIVNQLTIGKRYLKGNYKAHCSMDSCQQIADHCRQYALSAPSQPMFQSKCTLLHDTHCNDCEKLRNATLSIEEYVKSANIPEKEKADYLYDVKNGIESIFSWKGHILATIHQDKRKQEIMQELDNVTAFIIVDFAMKFLARRYREAMSNWFGKAGNGMHVTCVILRDDQNQLKKRTYISFTGKANQDAACVMAIYTSVLTQIKSDFPHITTLIEKSDNAGCYHNEDLISWKAYWPEENLQMRFSESLFNERQSGKDQCDRDSATAKRQMNYYVEQGNYIISASEMNKALCSATALCGFTSNILEVEESKKFTNPKAIKEISKIHNIKYIYNDGGVKVQVWMYTQIGQGKIYKLDYQPTAPKFKEVIPFSKSDSFGKVKASNENIEKQIFLCSNEFCIKTYNSYDALLSHLDFGVHEYEMQASQMSQIRDKWVSRFEGESLEVSVELPSRDTTQLSDTQALLMGWAIPVRIVRRLTDAQKEFLNKIFDEGASTGNKSSAEKAERKMRNHFTPNDYLRVSTIKSYFSRRVAMIKKGICSSKTTSEIDAEATEDIEDDVTEEDDVEEEEEDVEEEEAQFEFRNEAVEKMHSTVTGKELYEHEWIAVAYPRTWYPGQFIRKDDETGEVYVHFLTRSNTNKLWFVWPELQNDGKEDKSWVDSGIQ